MMIRHCVTCALLCTAMPALLAQTETPDSLDILLNELTVTAKNVITKNDRITIIPPKSKVDASTSGVDLLQKLALPGISVNQLTGSISITSGGTLGLYINGFPATSGQVAALAPESILRIEYHDNPGVKYAGADAVINYVTRRPGNNDSSFFLESLNCIGSGKFATLNEVATQFHHGHSTLSVNAGYAQMKRNNWVRDYEEIWHYPDHDVYRTEQGLPVNVGTAMFTGEVTYQYSPNDSNVFSTTLSLNHNNTPNKEEGDRHSLLTTSAGPEVTEIREHTAEKSLQPTLSLNYRHTFATAGSLSFNLEGSWLHSSADHSYSEQTDGTGQCNILSRTDGNQLGIFAKGVHEIKLGLGTLTSGLRHSQTFTSNTYLTNQQRTAISIRHAESALFAEYNLDISNWGFIGSLSAARLHAAQGLIAITKYALQPGASISFHPHPDCRLCYSINLCHKLPPLALMSNVTQEIQPGIIRRGNPHAKPYSALGQNLTLSYGNKYINISASVNYLNESAPVMSSTAFENGTFVQTYANGQYFRKLQSETTITITPLGQHLTLWIAPDIARYFARGNDFKLAKTILHIHFGITAAYRHLILTACTMSGAANSMYGYEITTEKPMNMILAGYKSKNWTIQAGAFNIMKTYWMKTENHSPLTPYKTTAHCNQNTYLAIKLTLTPQNKRPQPDNPRHLDLSPSLLPTHK